MKSLNNFRNIHWPYESTNVEFRSLNFLFLALSLNVSTQRNVFIMHDKPCLAIGVMQSEGNIGLLNLKEEIWSSLACWLHPQSF